jgi:hypothetical protein
MIMPYLITRCWYPNHLVDEVAKKYMENLEKYPPDESVSKTIVPAAVSATKKGIEVISIEEVERQKLGDALEREALFMAEYRNINGFRYETKTWATVEEAMKYIGME